jgi:hypothetical protein
MLTSGHSRAKIVLVVALVLLVLSVTFGLASLYPVTTGAVQSKTIINNNFNMSPNEVRRQGLGAFKGGENITVIVLSEDAFVKNFSIVTYNGLRFQNMTSRNIGYNFTVGADYYEAVFTTNATQSGIVLFQVRVTEPEILHPLSWLSNPAKILFLASLVSVFGILLNSGQLKRALVNSDDKMSLPSINKTNRRRLLSLVVLSLTLWFVLLAINPNPLGTFENWYTDHARHPYTASLFLKYGSSVFSQPLDTLASHDSSAYMFLTWPEMPHLYPVGSIAVFLPFGMILQNGFDQTFVFKLEIALFLVFAHVCLYFFLKVFFKKDIHLFWKFVGLYIIYVTLIIFAADGMFDSISFLFALFAVTMFLSEKYDNFVLLVMVASLFKYQAAIFLFPFIAVGVVRLFEKYKVKSLIKNKSAILSVVLLGVTGFTAYLSLPYLMKTRSELVLNGINAFTPHAQIQWSLQSFSVALTLVVTLIYAVYMLKRNRMLSLSAIFLLLPSFTLPYFQNWYLPFIFIYILVPQKKQDLEVTIVWLIFIIFVLSFGGIAFNPVQILSHFQSMFGI